MPPTPPIAALEDVVVRVGAVHILVDVDLRLDAGEAVGVFGANGAGKTTLLRLLATLVAPSAGLGRVLGADLSTQDRYDVRERIGYVGHVPGLYPELTLAENLAFVADARGIERARVGEALERVGLGGAADRRAEVCSHGMQRRAEFARILMTRPDLLLLDEPHSALDAEAVDLVDDLVGRTIRGGGAAVLVSHDRDRVQKVATRCLEIAGGRLQ